MCLNTAKCAPVQKKYSKMCPNTAHRLLPCADHLLEHCAETSKRVVGDEGCSCVQKDRLLAGLDDQFKKCRLLARLVEYRDELVVFGVRPGFKPPSVK